MMLVIRFGQFIEMLYYIVVLQQFEVADDRIIAQQPDTGLGYFVFGRELLDRGHARLSLDGKHQYEYDCRRAQRGE